MRRTVFIALLLVLAAVSASAKYTFSHFDASDGLSHNTVTAICQDRMGFMWFGTKDGLNRFDGHSFKVYRRNGGHGLGGDFINCLLSHGDKVWVGTDHGIYIYDIASDSFKQFTTKSTSGIRISNNINLLQAHGDDIYINSSMQGLFRYDTRSGLLRHFPATAFPSVMSLAFGDDGKIMAGVFGSGLFYTDNNFTRLTPFLDNNGNEPFHNLSVSGIVMTEQQQIFVSTEGKGMAMIDTDTKVVTPITGSTSKSMFAHFLLRNKSEIWAGTEDGLYVYELLTHNTFHYTYESTNPFSLSDNSLQCIYRDRDGGIWIGSYFGGIDYMPQRQYIVESFFPRNDMGNSISGRHVREMVEDSTGTIWIGTEDGGLNTFNPATRQFTHIAESNNFSNIHGLCVVGKNIWVGTFGNGLKIIDSTTHRVVASYTVANTPGSLADNNVFSICSSGDKVYVGLLGGLSYYDMHTGRFESDPVVKGHIITHILCDSHNNLWAASYGQGLYMRPRGAKRWKLYSNSDKRHNISSDRVLSVTEDSRHRIWVATEGGGVNLLDRKADTFRRVPIPVYSPRNIAYKIVEDSRNRLWISTNRGLVCYDPTSRTSNVYTRENGLLDNNFNPNSSLKARDGRIYMGCQRGFIAFVPESFGDTRHSGDIVATDLMVNNVAVDNFTENSPLKQNIVTTRHLELAYGQNSFALHMAMLNFSDMAPRNIEYRLEGLDRDWQQLYDDGYIKYTNLPAGHYTLTVREKPVNGQSTAKEYKLDIEVNPPFWLAWYAKLLYLLLLIGAVHMVWKYISHRSDMRRRIAMRKFEYEKEQELYQSKISFFTNVAHEIRTPLTLIKAPLEEIISNEDETTDSEMRENLDIMHKNVSRLINLTNQLLDFRRAERNGLRLNIERCNIRSVTDSVTERFRPLLKNKNVEYVEHMPEEPLYAHVDKEAFTKIVSNLTNNAAKYCRHYVEVNLSADDNTFTLLIRNDGDLVPAEMREKIFTSFFRLSQSGNDDNSDTPTGTGIGLPLARALAELHNGTLTMEEDGDGFNAFRLTMPLWQHHSISLDVDDTTTDNTADTTATTIIGAVKPADDSQEASQATVLVVEDNLKMQQFIKHILQRHYHVLTANEGGQALEVLGSNDVDAIVSDVMMEPMDGFRFCRMVKENLNYSHVPVVLLTALTLDSAKIKGMDSGANAYVEKPFSVEYLLSVIQNLLRSRDNMRQAYANSPFAQLDTDNASKTDREFMERMEKVMEEHISDSDFDVNRLAEEMYMSRTNLNRKIKGIYNLTPNNFIKVERLKRAAQLLKTGSCQINEVSYMVGFSSPSYFSQCFTKQFGLLPKDFVSTKAPGTDASKVDRGGYKE